MFGLVLEVLTRQSLHRILRAHWALGFGFDGLGFNRSLQTAQLQVEEFVRLTGDTANTARLGIPT